MFVPHLHFCGDCEEAIAIYEKAFSTKIDTLIRADNGEIIHAEMLIHGQRVMLNNRFGNKDKTTDCAIAAVITFITPEELLKCYEVLKPISTIIDQMSKASYTPCAIITESKLQFFICRPLSFQGDIIRIPDKAASNSETEYFHYGNRVNTASTKIRKRQNPTAGALQLPHSGRYGIITECGEKTTSGKNAPEIDEKKSRTFSERAARNRRTGCSAG